MADVCSSSAKVRMIHSI